jgi:hypothetical protein
LGFLVWQNTIWQLWFQQKNFVAECKQYCQMVEFQTKNPNLGKFWKVLQWEMMVFFMAILSILQSNGIFYGHLVHFVVIWYILPVFWYAVPRKIWQPRVQASTRTGVARCYVFRPKILECLARTDVGKFD